MNQDTKNQDHLLILLTKRRGSDIDMSALDLGHLLSLWDSKYLAHILGLDSYFDAHKFNKLTNTNQRTLLTNNNQVTNNDETYHHNSPSYDDGNESLSVSTSPEML